MDTFIYKWTDALTGKLYIGLHKGTPDDGYICSSKTMLEEYSSRPTDFTRVILEYGSLEECRHRETEILQAASAARNPLYYNKSNGNKDFYVVTHSDATRKQMSIDRLGVVKSNETKLKMSKPKSEKHKEHMRKPKTPETKLKMKKPKTDEHRENISKGRLGLKRKPFTDEHLKNLRESRNRKKIS